MDDINLDFDDELTSDAQLLAFQVQVQVPIQEPEPKPEPIQAQGDKISCLPQELAAACRMACSIYGETNSEYSEMFNHCVDDLTVGYFKLEAVQELQKLLHSDKDRASARWHHARRKTQIAKATMLRARWMAVCCAENVLRAVINFIKGLPYRQWIDRAHYRATLTEHDFKRKR